MDITKQVSFPIRFSHRGLVIAPVGFKPDAKNSFDYRKKLKGIIEEYFLSLNSEHLIEINENTLSIFQSCAKYETLEEWEIGRKEELKDSYPEGSYYINSKGRQTGTFMTGRGGAIQLRVTYERWFAAQYFETKLKDEIIKHKLTRGEIAVRYRANNNNNNFDLYLNSLF